MSLTHELVTCGDCIHRVKTICSKTGVYVDPYESACWQFKLDNIPVTGPEGGVSA